MERITETLNAIPRGNRGGFTFLAALLRPDDLLNLEVWGKNLRLDAGDPAHPVLVPQDAAQPALLALEFPPQTVAERAFYDNDPGDGQPPPPPEQKLGPGDVQRKNPFDAKDPSQMDDIETLHTAGDGVNARLGGPTRLVFRIPADARIPFTTEGLLDWSTFELSVSPSADVPYGGTPPAAALTIRPPEPGETSIELPYRLALSPTHDVIWDHARRVVAHHGRAEVWHTRLSIRGADGKPQPTDQEHTLPLRAIWSTEFPEDHAPGDFGALGALGAMSPYDRKQIVLLTSAFSGYAASVYAAFVPAPIQASLLMLSPLGGWLHSFGVWDPPYKIKPRLPIPRGGWRDWFSRRANLNRAVDVRAAARPAAAAPAAQESSGAAPVGLAPDAAQNLVANQPDLQHAVQIPDRIGQNLVDPIQILIPLYEIDENSQLDLSQWAHIASQGRDHYVRIVYDGKLKWTGHPASLVKVTERRIEPDPVTKAPVAYLRQYMYVVVRKPEMDYSGAGLANNGLGMPLKKIRLTTLVTPHINYPYLPPAQITAKSFWVMVGGKDFLFHGIGEDGAGNKIDFYTPLIFVPNSETDFVNLNKVFNDPAKRARRNAIIAGQKVSFAESLDGGQNTTLVTQSINFENEGDTRDTSFKPRLFSAEVHIPAVEQVLGTNQPTTIHYQPDYLHKNGFANPANKTGIFAEIVKENASGVLENVGMGLAFSAQQAGGFAVPNQDIAFLTRSLGPLGGQLNNALDNKFDPKTVFPDEATIFGAFKLADLLPQLPADSAAPKMKVHREGDKIITELDWSSQVTPAAFLLADLVAFQAKPDSTLVVHGIFTRSLTGAPQQEFSIHGTLNDFWITFLQVIQVNFDLFTFLAQSGKKPDANVKLNGETPVQFIGDLAFVEELRKLIPPGAFGGGVSIDLIDNPLGIKAGLELALPDAAVGVFALSGIAFSAGLTLPFLDGKAIVDFGFARRDHPFNLTVAFLGGGGFFHIALDTAGIRQLEAAFEFGASAALDIGVASGEVHMMAGIYFKMEKKVIPDAGEVTVSLLTGYLRVGGSMSVLGLITISVEFNLSFTYISKVPGDPHTGKAFGRATLTVSIEICFFSTSVDLTVERGFGGESGDPTFRDLIDSPAVWNEYAGAFA